MKKFKSTLFLKNTGVNDTGIVQQRVVQALRTNLNRYLYARREAPDAQVMDRFFNNFVKDHVRIDMHHFDTDRTNGSITNIRRTSIGTINVQPYVMILAFIKNYSNGIHEGHSIGAFKYRNVLYCFNPWGQRYILTDKRTSKILPDNLVWERLRKMYRCSKAVVFTGNDYQLNNKHGVCVGLSADFGAFLYIHLMKMKAFKDTANIPGPLTAVEHFTTSLVYSHQYNQFVERLIATNIGAFRNGDVCVTGIDRVMNRLRSNQRVINNNRNNDRNLKLQTKEINLLNVLHKVVNRNVAFRNRVLATLSNDPRVASDARRSVRETLLETEPRLRRVHGNTINANVSRYLSSGNINISRLKNRNTVMT
jgi:hypothetical protein